MAPLGYFLVLCSLEQALGSYPIWWSLAIGPQYTSLSTHPILCASIPGLVPKQLRFCRNYVEIMPSVAEGVKLGIQECQHQFRGRRWNCTTVDDSLAIFGPVLDKATRESAFVHAIASAGVAFAVTRSCAEGSAAICGCSSRHQGAPGEGWKWGGCSEDIEFGGMVSREFADARENRPDARSAMNRHNNEAARRAGGGLPAVPRLEVCWWRRALPQPPASPANPVPPLSAATRESAFVHAIASAGVAFAVTRSCAEGSAAICGCSSRHQGAPGEGWKWGGCSEDIEFGGMVSREFADARENRPDARSAMNRHNNEAGSWGNGGFLSRASVWRAARRAGGGLPAVPRLEVCHVLSSNT
ncbi:Hypothetical predicted protein [Marmota monax]|uniref:Protein Wnt n=1 Tax=Marmota monax TaxID=9995 RepID=A0A5E4C8G4_MARMO|nr:Hypothetical predicted protein [Marmota monax]